jgi:hypothetical protein
VSHNLLVASATDLAFSAALCIKLTSSSDIRGCKDSYSQLTTSTVMYENEKVWYFTKFDDEFI